MEDKTIKSVFYLAAKIHTRIADEVDNLETRINKRVDNYVLRFTWGRMGEYHALERSLTPRIIFEMQAQSDVIDAIAENTSNEITYRHRASLVNRN